MKRFLVASDLSERSDRAVQRALKLARAHRAECHILHVVDEDLPADIAAMMRDEAAARLTRDVAALAGGETATTEAVIGDPVLVIAEQARARDADLVVFGIHRPRAFFDMLCQTTVERMVRLIDRPALLVRNPATEDYSRVLVPVSFSSACAKALSAAQALLPEAEISAFHAVHLPFAGLTHEKPGGPMDRELTAEAEAVRSSWCVDQGLPEALCEVTPMTGSLIEVLDRRIEAERPQLIALGAHTRNRLAARINCCVAEDWHE